MTHDELLAEIIGEGDGEIVKSTRRWHNTKALRAVVELHKPEHSVRGYHCAFDDEEFPCTHHQAIEKELS